MKDQYFGDINDYRKYGLLRILIGRGTRRAAVCWMLTPPDGRTDGRLTSYLATPEEWRDYDPELFEYLHKTVHARQRRRVREIERAGLLSNTRFHSSFIPDDTHGRTRYFDAFFERAAGCQLVFFDPDNGLEVPSVACGHRSSSKYLYWRELETAFANGHTLLVYQHFPRVPRDAFEKQQAEEILQRTRAREVIALRTNRVVFLLAPQTAHREEPCERVRQVFATWREQFHITRYPL
jgi:hypothetical protein